MFWKSKISSKVRTGRIIFLRMMLIAGIVFLVSSIVSANDNDDRAPRYFSGYQFEDAGLLIPVPIDPLWDQSISDLHSNTSKNKPPSVTISSPAMYYPSTTIEFVLYKQYKVTEVELQQAALTALNKLRNKNKLPKKDSVNDFEYVKYGNIKGYMDKVGLTLNGKSFSLQYLFGIMPSNQPILVTIGVPRGQLDHIDHVVTKILNKVAVLPSALPEPD